MTPPVDWTAFAAPAVIFNTLKATHAHETGVGDEQQR